MLPDFPIAKNGFRKDLYKFSFEQLRNSTIRQLVTNKQIHEGHRVTGSVRFRPDDSTASTFKVFEKEIPINREQIIEQGVESILDMTLDTLSQFNGQQTQMIIEDISQTIENTGKTTQSQNVSRESLLSWVRDMDLSFDVNGRPRFQLVLFPEAAARKAEILSWFNEPEFAKHFDLLVKEKHNQWLELESKRQLVD